MITVHANASNMRQTGTIAHLCLSAHLYCHLAAEGVPAGDGVPAREQGRGEDGLKLLEMTRKNVMFTDSLSLSLFHTHTHTHIYKHSLHLLKKSGANRKQAYADREELTDRRASYKRERKKTQISTIH